MKQTSDTKDLVFIATWAIPFGMLIGFLLELLYSYIKYSNLFDHIVKAYSKIGS